jgi:hypothetical protein
VADGQTMQFWECDLRFKTDSSDDGPSKGSPAIVGAGMVGDRDLRRAESNRPVHHAAMLKQELYSNVATVNDQVVLSRVTGC